MKKYFLSLLLWCISAEVFAQTDNQPDAWVEASVIGVDKDKSTIYIRKIDGASVFSFSVGAVYVKRFQVGKAINVQFKTKKVMVPVTGDTKEEVPFLISDIRREYNNAYNFFYLLVEIQARVKSVPGTNNAPFSERKMTTVARTQSNVVKACCDEGTANGIVFLIPEEMTEEDLERLVYVYNDLVLTDKKSASPSLLVYPISGYYVDSVGQTDSTTPPGGVEKVGWDQKDNIKVRPNTGETEKWVITPVTTMKGVLGRLDINFPADAERSILIYQPTDNKFIASVSRNDKIYNIAPGQYRFTLTNVPVENVPIQKGHETRLKAGILNVVSEGRWNLYDDTKKKQYTSGDKPKKIPLPVGSYQLKLGVQFYPVVIKDGETVEY